MRCMHSRHAVCMHMLCICKGCVWWCGGVERVGGAQIVLAKGSKEGRPRGQGQ